MGNPFPIEFVGNSNFNFIQHIKNVKFCQSNAVREECSFKMCCFLFYCSFQMYICASILKTPETSSSHSRSEAIYHVSVSDDDKIQPPAAPLPSCGYAHLMTPRLQQLSYCLQSKQEKNILTLLLTNLKTPSGT